MRFKKGVRLAGVKPEIVAAWIVADRIFPEMVITSVVEGMHGVNSLHSKGYACDIRTRDYAGLNARGYAIELRDALTDEYDIVVEADHIHVEFDPK